MRFLVKHQIAIWMIACSVSFDACSSSAVAPRYSELKKSTHNEHSKSSAASELILGVFKLASDAVVDGDTLRVEGLDSTLRLLAIDTEETFQSGAKSKQDITPGSTNLSSFKPQKTVTPMGREAKTWAKDFFNDVDDVRLERDHIKAIKGTYGRYLTYVFAEKNGVWVHYNLEAVRAGMTPYFTKYGYSRRFHDEFTQAQAEAQKEKRGIWAPNCQCYPDYDMRLAWWNHRADFIRQYEEDAKHNDDLVSLDQWDALIRLEKLIGQEVTVLGTVGSIKDINKNMSKVLLSRRRGNDFPLIFFDSAVFKASGIEKSKGEFVRVNGVIQEYENQYTKKKTLQIVVKVPSQIKNAHSLEAAFAGKTNP